MLNAKQVIEFVENDPRVRAYNESPWHAVVHPAPPDKLVKDVVMDLMKKSRGQCNPLMVKSLVEGYIALGGWHEKRIAM